MTVRRIILTVLTVLAAVLVGVSLVDSWNQPQIQGRLELYQTNLLLQAAEYQGENSVLYPRLLGADPLAAAMTQYEAARTRVAENLQRLETRLETLKFQEDAVVQLQGAIEQIRSWRDELIVKTGILQAETGKLETALVTWQELQAPGEPIVRDSLADTGEILSRLWDEGQVMPDAEGLVWENLDGWFRDRTLAKIYQIQDRQESLAEVAAEQQQAATKAIGSLAIIIGIPGFGMIIGSGILIFLLVQRLIKGKDAIVSLKTPATSGQTPWDWETVWQVLILGFFFVGQVAVPLVFQLLPLPRPDTSSSIRAAYILISYLLLAFGGLSVLYLSIKPFFPLPEGWFRIQLQLKTLWWGLGGYLVALPLVVVVSLFNQQLWQGRGGSNPILPIALEDRNGLAVGVFFFTASVAAPIFEEIMFRGFLLPSLTRYLSPWGAILLSSFLFAVAHLQLSELLPLATLGMVLGFVYTRSGNLLAPMLLHCLWNSGTLVSLFVLGSSI
ncbi:MAG TPA: CPBP family intramembrane metalloprotease [Oscillatoriaceae cyanobacterium M33_DOE_052]|nr:CPBP family intramembrane metalloprotease [Oscillatoriaceae cyanobacterium M33_DOE_052]